MSHPGQFPPIPSLAFSEGNTLLWVSEVSEAVIGPKKERESPFKVRRRRASTVAENRPAIADPNVRSPPITAIVSTREKMENWLRESGPGSSCLWVHIENFSLDSRKKVLSGQLKLSYRLRSEESLSLPLLNGTLLEVAPEARKEGWKRISKKSVHEILHAEDSARGSSRSAWDAHGNTTGMLSPNPDGSPLLEWKSDVANKYKAVNLVMPERGYRQLLQIVSPGGVVREYQSLLRRAAENSNFLDVDFQLVDLQKWLTQHHPFALFWEENDVVIVRKEAEGLKWILLRFDFQEGVIRTTEGATLCTLEVIFGTKTTSKPYTRKSWWGDASAGDVVCKGNEKQLEEVRSKVEWKIWDSVSSAQNYPFASLLSRIISDILGSSATMSAAEIESVKFLFSSDPCEGSTHEQEELTGLSAIQTIFTCRGRKASSAKETHALAMLRSDSKDLRLEAICSLLDLLLGVREGLRSSTCAKVPFHSKSPPSHSNPDTSRSSSIVWLHPDQEDVESSYREQLRQRSHSGEAPEMSGTIDRRDLEVERSREPRTVPVTEHTQGADCELGVPRVGSQTDKFHTVAEELAKREVGVMQITEWVKNGFLEVLVENVITQFRDAHKQDGKMEKTVRFSFETVLEACLKVLELLPGEGTSRMVSLILQSLHELSEVIAKLSCTDDKVGEGAKEGEKTCSSTSKQEISLLFDNISMQRSEISHDSRLQESFAKALKFSKLLFAVITRSSVLAGSLAVSGGLDLVLDFYSCLIRKFPFNLRIGAKSGARKFSAEGVLPGEVLKGQVEPLKVLPCIFPGFCVRSVAQTCLMDSTLYPLQERVDLSGLTATGDSSCSLEQFMNGSDFDVRSGILSGKTCNPIERLLTLTPGRSVVREPISCGLSLHGNPNSDKLNGSAEVETAEIALPMLPSCGNMVDFCRAPPETTDFDGFKDIEVPNSAKQKQRRPYVPRLALNSIQLSTSKSGPFTPVGSKISGQPTSASLTDSVDLASSTHGCSASHFDILRAVSDVKYELLRSMATLFATRSLSFIGTRGYLHQKLESDEGRQLVLRFLPDMIGGFLDTAPATRVWRTKRILLQVVSILNKSELFEDTCTAEALYINREEDSQSGPRWSGPGPPVSNECKSSVDILLLEIGERLTCMICHLSEMLTKPEVYGKDSTSIETWTRARAAVCCEPSVLTKTLYNGHLLSLWVDVGILLKFLGDFVLLWPEEGSARLLLKSCGKSVEMAFGLLAKLSSQSDWNLAQILAMQHLFNLSTACMNSAAHDKSPGHQVWNDVDNFFWQLLMESDSNWTCVKNFADWILLKSCQGCLRTLLEGYQKVLWEPLEIYYGLLGQKVNPLRTQGKSPDTFGGGETLKKSVLPLLRSSILMMKKKLKCQCQSSPASPILYMSRLMFLLDFLMNPVEGLLMTVIKTPVHYGQLNKMQRKTVTSSISNWSKPRRVKDQSVLESNPQPILSASKEQFGTGETEGLCRKCATSSNRIPCFQKFTSSMKHECISILADIFSLKAFDASEEHTNLCINPRTQNPFLFRKYVNPFLEVISFCFLKSYTDRGEYSERELQLPWLICPLSRCSVTEGYGQSAYCGLQGYEPVNTAGESPDGRALLSTKDKADLVTWSIRSHEDEAASVACIQYARVLLALAQNPTDDVSQCFQHVRVMNFLVQQIGLEYEVSQVATPREIVQAERAINTPSVSTKLQFQECGDADLKIRRGAHMRREDRSSSSELSTIREGESIQRERYEKLEVDTQLEVYELRGTSFLVNAKNGQVSRSPSTSVRLKMKLSPVVAFKEEFQLNRTLSQTSKKASKEQSLYTVPELVQGSCWRESACCLGFHSARDIRSTDLARRQSYCILVGQPLLRFQQTQMKLQKAIASGEDVPKSLLLFRERNRNIMPKNPVLSERGTSSTWTLFQRGRGPSSTFVRNSSGRQENDSELSQGARSHVVPLTQEHVHDQLTPERERETDNTGSNSKAVKYTGRFFDLNEEVERELAEEDFPSSGSQTVEGTESTEVSERLRNEIQLEQRGMPLTDQRATTVGLGDMQCLVNVPQPESTRGLNWGTRSKQKADRPAIPRLNLPKSVRKGRQDVISDTTMDLELLLSTTSTQESLRLSSLLELQKEFADSDKDEKTWKLGSYETERLRRRLYRHAGLHVLLLELYVALMLNNQFTRLILEARVSKQRIVWC